MASVINSFECQIVFSCVSEVALRASDRRTEGWSGAVSSEEANICVYDHKKVTAVNLHQLEQKSTMTSSLSHRNHNIRHPSPYRDDTD